MVQVPLIDFNTHHAPLKESIIESIKSVINSNQFIMGPHVERFQKEMADYLGAAYTIGVSSGTDALLVSLMALDVGTGDAVVTTPFSFFATAGVITRLGARPYFADIETGSYNIDPVAAEKTIIQAQGDGYRVKAIIPVHLYGQCASMPGIMDLAAKYNLHVVEDAAQAIGSRCPLGQKIFNAGTMGDLGCFSFFPSKNLGCLGDGGLVATDNKALADKINMLRAHGARPKYYHAQIGGNFRLDALQAAILSVKLPHLNGWHEKRKLNADRYRFLFKNAGLDNHVLPPMEKYPETPRGHIYHQFVIRVKERDLLRQHLSKRGVGSEVYYPVPFHMQECFRGLCYKEGDFPEAEQAAREVLALPVYPELTPGQQEYVVQCVADFYYKSKA